MRVALCQITSTADPSANLAQMRSAVARAATEGAVVALFPEATMACFGTPLAPLAERLDGPWASAVREIADEYRMLVVAGMFTPAADGRVYNTLLATGRGQHVGYHKIHLFDAFGFTESKTVAAGDELVTIDIDSTTVGLATCYDIRFPELFRALADRGATTVLLGASWGAGEGKREQWELLVRARALDSTCWLLASGQANPSASGMLPHPTAPTGIGYSMAVDPTGRVVASLGAEPDTLIVPIDAELVAATRKTIPVLANRRL